MSKQFNSKKFISQLTKLGSRQLDQETYAAKIIVSKLEMFDIDYKSQLFETNIPICEKATLLADGKSIICKSTSLISGEIKSKDYIISSLISSQNVIDQANINFNPKSKALSISNYYFAPSVCVRRSDLNKIIKAEKVIGEIKVVSKRHQSQNILIGNLRNPKNLLFAHYDSLGKGATDNASGVAVVMGMIIEKKINLVDNLVILSGNEEISFDYPVYWGHGYREFEKKYQDLLIKADIIIIIDSVGNDKPNMTNDHALLKLSFPLKKMEQIITKTVTVYGNFDNLMKVYHSDLDNDAQIKSKHLLQAEELIGTLIS